MKSPLQHQAGSEGAKGLRTFVFHPPSPVDAGMFDALPGDPGNAPWIYVCRQFEMLGIRIQTSYRYEGSLQDADWIVFMAMPAAVVQRFGVKRFLRRLLRREPAGQDFYKSCIKAGMANRLAVMLWEPPVVSPENYLGKAHRKFLRVFTWSENLLRQGGDYRPIVWPQPPVNETPADVSFADRKLLCNFSGNKNSAVQGELYSERFTAIRYMEKTYLADFDHYGPGWDQTFPSWRGVVNSKFDIYPHYRFGLCFENMKDEPGYITEKIFDCLRAGCVPIYFGAPEITERVPAAAFIDRRDFVSIEAMLDSLALIDEAQWIAMRKAGWEYLHSPAFDRYQRESFFRMLREGLTQ